MPTIEKLTFKTKPEYMDWAGIEAMWREAEGIDQLDGGWLFDHLYPIYGDKSGPSFEGWTALSYLAGITKRLRLGLLVSAIPYRNPALLAKMVTTFDHFSQGRLDLGLGAGWNEDEASAYGMPLLPIGKRLSQFDEACAIVTSLLTQETTTLEGEYYQVKDAYCEPKPLQKPHPPIVMGGVGEKRFLKIAARYADDWNHPGGSPEDFAHKLSVLHAHCETIGRDPAEIMPSCHVFVGENPNETADQAAALAEVGARHICLYFVDKQHPDLLGPTVEAIARA
jgi:F420-dependent oxidoreductase-like protein